jgi:murein peptide amidase A
MQRLGINNGKYFGERIDIERVLKQIELAGEDHGWRSETFLKADSYRLIALIRRVARPLKRIYISTGIHGDEPAGPLSVLQLLQENLWPDNADIWLCPCLNPTGFKINTRESAQGFDLNRQYLQPEAEEIKAHISWLEKQPAFDVSLCLHEDWEAEGFYVYELNPDNQSSFARGIIARAAEVCPIDMSSMIEGRPAANGIINPSTDPRSRPQWPEAFYLLTNKTRLSYTLEAPSDFQLVTRVAASVAAVRAVVDSIEKS